ncbi:EF-hand domain-containing protein [Neorhizobium petrolearium]|uniref:EF-hand domain-containing protein n=1 Tax=Neorhizobium petrolearium TaxID=515361 RepID=A0ABY8M5P6_9HYPH|nr:hypothetical protein [Neorhizobium petrolearium]MCC2609090.1 hypothetical protein [Neorhizobium petrolearium]WGI69321.1 hypothetical protein QEO92_04355 [Neorhizobium petrolearium]
MKRILTAIVVLASTGLLAGTAYSQAYGDGPWGRGFGGQGWGMGMGSGPMMHAPGRGRFAMIDANGDGKVTAEEAASAAEDVFIAMDADDNGDLSKDEYMAVRMGPQMGWNKDRQAAREKAKLTRFDEMDQDKNGTVTQVEFIAGAKAHYDAADADKNGEVTPWEWRSQQWN